MPVWACAESDTPRCCVCAGRQPVPTTYPRVTRLCVHGYTPYPYPLRPCPPIPPQPGSNGTDKDVQHTERESRAERHERGETGETGRRRKTKYNKGDRIPKPDRGLQM